MALKDLQQNEMMAHLIDSLDRGENIGHYGRLVFAMVSRYFLEEDEVITYLTKDPDCEEAKARDLLEPVSGRDYHRPRRDRVLEWMNRQDFALCNEPSDPDACNVYKELQFPRDLYESIERYREEKAQVR